MLFACVAAGAAAVEGALRVESVDDGGFRITRNGELVVSSVSVDLGIQEDSDILRSSTVIEAGKVWNVWSEKRDRRFRLELVERTDGSVEITMMGQVDPESAVRKRVLNLDLPRAALDGKKFRRLSSSRSFRNFNEESGRFEKSMKAFTTRFLACDGLVFDFNPLGPGDSYGQVSQSNESSQEDSNAVMGMWSVCARGDDFRFSAGNHVRASCGGMSGAKIIIREGGFDDYGSWHLVRSYRYYQTLPARHLLAFGSPKRGKSFQEGNMAFSQKRKFGWLGDVKRSASVGHHEGMMYSSVRGKGRAVYRFSGLPDGYYIFGYVGGNYHGASNAFSISLNGIGFVSNADVPVDSVRSIFRAVHVNGGVLDVEFDGEWLVSSLSLQPLLGDAEDFSVRRGFWATDGYEPCMLFRNVDTRCAAVFSVSDETQALPVPGEECLAAPKALLSPVDRPDPKEPSLSWMQTAKMVRFLSNSATLSEFDEPGSLGRYIKKEYGKKNVRVVMLSGLHSRHTYLGHEARSVEAIRKMTDVFHKHGIKVIDHEDATLLWNIGAGFRVMMERLDHTVRTVREGIPSGQFCLSNPRFSERYYAYLRKLVEAGVDGFQIDEVEFWHHSCVCRYCRDAFHRDTGWQIPLNELDADWNNPKSALRRRWHDWRVKSVTNWFVELRRRNKDINANLVLSNYTTNDGFYSPFPRRNASSDIIDLGRVMNYFGVEMMTRSTMKNGRNLIPIARMRDALKPKGTPPVWCWFYNFNWQNNYFAWAMSELVGQTPLLSDIPAEADTPKYEQFAASGNAMSRVDPRPEGGVAILFSAASRDWNEGGKYRSGILGTAQALEALHIPYRFVSDQDIAGDLPADCKVLFLGEAQCISDAGVANIKKFAQRGGTVRLSKSAGTRNELGFLRDKRAFDDARGFVFDDTDAASFELDENWSDLKWSFNPDPAKEAAFRASVKGWAEHASAWRIQAPDKVFTAVWREREGSYVIHFLNGTGVNMKPGDKVTPHALNPAFPPVGEAMSVTTPKLDGMTAVAYSPEFDAGRELCVKMNADGTANVTLPPGILKGYLLVRLECRQPR